MAVWEEAASAETNVVVCFIALRARPEEFSAPCLIFYTATNRSHKARRLGGHGVDYAHFDTSQPMDRALFRYLGARHRFERARRVG